MSYTFGYEHFQPDYDYISGGINPDWSPLVTADGPIIIYSVFRGNYSNYSSYYSAHRTLSNSSYEYTTHYATYVALEPYRLTRVIAYNMNDITEFTDYTDTIEEYTQSGYTYTTRVQRVYCEWQYTGVYFEISDPSKEGTILYYLNNVSSSYTDETVNLGDTVTFVLTADDFYTFTETPYITFGNDITYFTVNDDNTQAELAYTFETNDYNYEVHANAETTYNFITFNLENCIINDDTSPQPANTEITYTLTPIDTYGFRDNTPYIEDSNGEIYTFTVSDDYKTASITLTLGSGIEYTITGTATYLPPQYQLTLDLTNATCSLEAGEYDEGANLVAYIYNETGYYFSKSSALNITPAILDENGEVLDEITLTGSTSINGSTYYTGGYRVLVMNNDRTIYAHAVDPYSLVYCTATEDLTNCYCSHNDTYLQGALITLTVSVSSAYTSVYVLNDPPEIRFNNGTVLYFEISEDKLTSTLTFTVEDDFTIYAHAEAERVYHNVIADLTHCTLESETTFAEGEQYTIILRADDGYVFNDNIVVTYDLLTFSIGGDYFFEDDTVVRYTFPAGVTIWTDITIQATAIRNAEQVSAFAHLYKVTTRILTDLSRARFYKVSSESSEEVDYGQYITNLMEIPFALDEDMIGDNANIQLGTYDSGVSAPSILYHDLTVDIGTIHVEPKYNNVYDYRETTAILHLPFSEDIEIPLEYCMDKDVHIQYKIDLYSGDTTIIITSDFTGEIVATSTVTIGTQIPFIQMQTDSIVNRIEKFTDNGLRTAFIEVKRNIPYNVFCEFGKPTVDYGCLSDYKGYIEVSDCTVNVPCTTQEQELIKTTLQSGIIIK